MRRVFPACIAELGELEAPRGGLLVLGGGVVPVLALGTLQCDDLAHCMFSLLLTWPAALAGKQLVSREGWHAATQGLFWPLLPNPEL